jgi:hypothetical protein
MAENGKPEGEFVPLSELMAKTQKPQKDAFISIESLVDKEFTVFGAEFYQGDYGEYSVVRTDCGSFRTSSRVLLKQLRAIQTAIEQRKLRGVRVRLCKKKSASKRTYYCFE